MTFCEELFENPTKWFRRNVGGKPSLLFSSVPLLLFCACACTPGTLSFDERADRFSSSFASQVPQFLVLPRPRRLKRANSAGFVTTRSSQYRARLLVVLQGRKFHATLHRCIREHLQPCRTQSARSASLMHRATRMKSLVVEDAVLATREWTNA
jgi:hypothetical protein